MSITFDTSINVRIPCITEKFKIFNTMALIGAAKVCSYILKPSWAHLELCSFRSFSLCISGQAPFQLLSKYLRSKDPLAAAQHNRSAKACPAKESDRKRRSVFTTLMIAPFEFCSRHFASSATRAAKQQSIKQAAPQNICPVKQAIVKKKPWTLFSTMDKEERDQERERKERECRRDCIEHGDFQKAPDSDFSEYGDRAFKSCGTAYIVQKENVCETKIPESVRAEENMVDKMERHPDLKNIKDPMPDFKTVEQRLLDLADKKLHPFYKKYMFTPQKPCKVATPKFKYKSRSGPIKPEDIPLKCKFNKDLLERKNIYADFKRVEPPRQLLAKILEIQMNEKPTMEKKIQGQNE